MSYDESQVPAVVIDNGGTSIKAGFSGFGEPDVVVPTIVGWSRPGKIDENKEIDYYAGEEADKKRTQLFLRYPIDWGIITNFDEMEKLWHHVFYNRLQVAPSEHAVFMTETMYGTKANREKMTQIVFEKFRAPAFYVGIQGVLSLYSTTRTTGIVVECGGSISHVVPVYEGYCLPHAVLRLDYAGSSLTRYMRELFAYHSSPYMQDLSIINDIKEKLGKVEVDYDHALSTISTENYELPDGQVVSVGNERYMCSEPLFQPSLVEDIAHNVGIHEATYLSIQKIDADIRKDMYSNILLSGGSSLFPGLRERYKKELRAIVEPPDLKNSIALCESQNKKYSAWMGASMLSSLSSFQQMWVCKSEYEESGPSIVHRKCY